MTAFDRDTAVDPVGGGAYRAHMSRDWFAPRGPNGGYVAAVVLRAMQDAVGDPERAPRSLTCHYTRPPAEGECTVRVTVERAGRSLSTLSARLEQDGRLMVLAVAAFAKDFPAVMEYREPPPVVTSPNGLRVPPGGPHIPAIAQRFVVEGLIGPRPFSGGDEAVTGGWLRLAEPQAADAAALALYSDAWLPAPFARLTEPVPVPTVDLTIHFRARLPLPGADPEAPVLARFRSTTAHAGFSEEDGELWAPDGTLLAQSRQLAVLVP